MTINWNSLTGGICLWQCFVLSQHCEGQLCTCKQIHLFYFLTQVLNSILLWHRPGLACESKLATDIRRTLEKKSTHSEHGQNSYCVATSFPSCALMRTCTYIPVPVPSTSKRTQQHPKCLHSTSTSRAGECYWSYDEMSTLNSYHLSKN